MASSNLSFEKYNNAIQLIKDGNIEPLYFLIGEDQFLQKFFVDQLEIELSKIEVIDKIIMTVDELGSKEVINKINESDLFSSRKIIVLRNPNLLRGKTRDELLDYCSSPNINKFVVLECGCRIFLVRMVTKIFRVRSLTIS